MARAAEVPLNNTMSYKEYLAHVEYDDTDGIRVGKPTGIRDGVSVHAFNGDDLKLALYEAVDDD